MKIPKTSSIINLIFIFILSFFGLNSYSQGIVLKGQVISKDDCEFADGGGYVVKHTNRVYNTFFKLSDYELSFKGTIHNTYKLSDKKVDDDGNRVIIHYFAESSGDLYIVGVRDCEDKIQVAIFPFDGSPKFIQYKIKLYKNTNNGRD